MDLEAGDSVWWVFHADLDDHETYEESPSFTAWGDRYFTTLREEMAGDLVDPEGSPVERRRIEAKNVRFADAGCFVGLLLFSAVAIVVVWAVRAWLR